MTAYVAAASIFASLFSARSRSCSVVSLDALALRNASLEALRILSLDADEWKRRKLMQ